MDNRSQNTAPAGAPPVKEDSLTRLWKRILQAYAKADARCPHLYLFWCFFIPFSILGLSYAIRGVYPFGDSSVLVLDLNGQYVYFFEALRDFVYGEGSLLYSFSRSLGGEFMGMYAYYLASPFSYLVALYPKENITEALYLMMVLKCGCCGLTMGLYLEKVAKTKRLTNIAFSLCYALCTWAVAMQHNTMWTDNLILLPLVALGIEQLIRYRRYKLFTLSLTMAVLSNFYIGYMMCLFVVVYSFYAYFSKTKEECNPLGEKAHFIRAVARVALFSGIAVAISSVIWIPTYYSLQFGKNTFTTPDFGFYARFDLFDLLTRCFFGSYDTVDRPGLPFLYCSTLTLFMLPLYFLRKDIRIREKAAGALIALFFLFSFNINTLDMVWHGFQEPNWLNYRYAFMLVFLLLSMAAKGFEGLRDHSRLPILLTAGALAAALALSVYFGNDHMIIPLMLFPSLILIGLTTFFLLRVLKKKEWSPVRVGALALTLLCVEMLGSTSANLGMLDYDVYFSSRSSYRNFLTKLQGPVDYVKQADPSFYRMEKAEMRKCNDPFALGYRGLSGSTSTLNKETIAYLANLGLHSTAHYSEYKFPVPVSDSMLGLKYLIVDKGVSVSDTYRLFHQTSGNPGGDVDIYLNPFALSLAYAVRPEGTAYSMDNGKREEQISAMRRMNEMLNAMAGGEENVFRPLSARITDKINCSASTNTYFNGCDQPYTYCRKINAGESAYLVFTFTVEEEAEVYFQVPSNWPQGITLTLDGEEGRGSAAANVCFLGRLSAGEHTLQVEVQERLYIAEGNFSNFYALDEQRYAEVFSTLQEGNYRIDSTTEDSFTGSITLPAGRTSVMTSIPYDEGWHVFVDGQPVEIYKAHDAVIAFDATEGEHTLTMYYFPDCYKTAIRLCAAGGGLFVAIVAVEITVKVVRRKKAQKKG